MTWLPVLNLFHPHFDPHQKPNPLRQKRHFRIHQKLKLNCKKEFIKKTTEFEKNY